MQNNNNWLTKNSKYTTILRILGKSPKPLLRTEIIDLVTKSEEKIKRSQIYEMLDYLAPDIIEGEGLFLFNWNTILNNTSQQQRLLSFLQEYYELNWISYFKDDTAIFFEQNNNKNEIQIKNKKEPTKKVKLVIDPSSINLTGQLIITHDDKETVTIFWLKNNYVYFLLSDLELHKKLKEKNRPILNLVGGFHETPITYLNISLDPITECKIYELYKKIDEIVRTNKSKRIKGKIYTDFQLYDGTADLFTEIDKLEQNRKSWRYSLNLRGLLQYIINELNDEKEKKSLHTKGRSHNIRIHSVLQNLSKNNENEFPFLLYYNDFRNELKKVKSSYSYFGVETIREIASSLKPTLANIKIEFLEYIVTKTYYYKVIKKIIEHIKYGEIPDDYSLVSMIRKYQMKNLDTIQRHLEEEQKKIKRFYDFLYATELSEDIVKQTNLFIDEDFKIH